MSDERTVTQLRLENRNQAERIKALQAEVKKHHDVMVEIRRERDLLRWGMDKYGGHLGECATYDAPTASCTCGYEKLVRGSEIKKETK